jgi:putative Holliday junction resolvase
MSNVSSYICFDYGLKNIGVALGNTLTREARPITILPAVNGKPRWEEIEALVKEWQPTAFVVGNPIAEDAGPTELSAQAAKFARQLEGRLGLGVTLHDERFSSKEAKSRAKDSGHKGDFVKHPIDDLAAAIILESWLNRDHV